MALFDNPFAQPGALPLAPPSWEDRLAQAAYTPPSGVRITFDYEDVAYTRTKRTTAFQFPGVDGQLVQDHGVSGHQIPLRIFIAGPDYDRAAKVFEAALAERGYGKLEHPVYGTKTVVPFGDFTRRDDLVSAGNQAVFEVTFFETFETPYPTGKEGSASAALVAIDLYGQAAALDFASALDLGSVSEQLSFLDKVQNALATVGAVMESIANAQSNIAEQFAEVKETIDLGIDVLVASPLALAQQTQNLILLPSHAMTSITARLDGYGNLASNLAANVVSGPGGPGGGGPMPGSFTGTGNDAQDANAFQVSRLFAGACVAGAVSSVIFTSTQRGDAQAASQVSREQANAAADGLAIGSGSFLTAGEAIAAADQILAAVEAFAEWNDANYAKLAESDQVVTTPLNVDSGETVRTLRTAAEMAAGYLVRLSFDLRAERSMTLSADRNVLELCAELYGDIGLLDFFIESNSFTADEIIEIPRGRAVKYYV